MWMKDYYRKSNDAYDKQEIKKIEHQLDKSTVIAVDNGNIISFSNLLNVPDNFCPCPNWDSLKISVKPYLHCIVEPCVIDEAHLIFTDPYGVLHDIDPYTVTVKQVRVVGNIEYIISAQSVSSDVQNLPASISTYYDIKVNKIVEFIDDCEIEKCSVFVDCQNLIFDDPSEFIYGNNHALKVKGEFVLNLGYIINPSFEHLFTGWDLEIPPRGTAQTTAEFDIYRPIEGSYFALLKTDGPGSYTRVNQRFNAKAGDVISGWSFFKTNDYMPFNDTGEVTLKQNGTTIATLFSASVSTVGDYGQTPWTYWEFPITANGVYTIEGKIMNQLDSILDSYLGLDAFQLIPA